MMSIEDDLARLREAAAEAARREAEARLAEIEKNERLEAEEIEKFKDGTNLEDFFGEDAHYVREFVDLMNGRYNPGSEGLVIVTGARTVTYGTVMRRLLGKTSVTEYKSERIRGYRIGRRVPKPDGYDHPPEKVVFLCDDGVLRENTGERSAELGPANHGYTQVHQLQRGQLETGEVIVTGWNPGNSDIRENTGYAYTEFSDIPIRTLLLQIAVSKIPG